MQRLALATFLGALAAMSGCGGAEVLLDGESQRLASTDPTSVGGCSVGIGEFQAALAREEAVAHVTWGQTTCAGGQAPAFPGAEGFGGCATGGRGGRVIHFSRYSRTTSEALRPSASALRNTASQRSSGMRMLRRVVPLGIDDLNGCVGVQGCPAAVIGGHRQAADSPRHRVGRYNTLNPCTSGRGERDTGAHQLVDVAARREELVAVNGQFAIHGGFLSPVVYLQNNLCCTYTQAHLGKTFKVAS